MLVRVKNGLIRGRSGKKRVWEEEGLDGGVWVEEGLRRGHGEKRVLKEERLERRGSGKKRA